MKKFTAHQSTLVLLIALTVVGLFAGCTSNTSNNSTGSTVGTATDPSDPQATTNAIETTEATTESTTAPTTEPTTEPTKIQTTNPTTRPPKTTSPETEPQEETNPPATKSTEPTSGSSTNRKTLYGYDTTTGRTVPEELTSCPGPGFADLENLIAWDGVSPLIFIYSDGTVGTEPREGAQYESMPYILSTYVIYRDASGRAAGETCEYCGKEVETLTHKPKNRVDYCTHYNFSSYCSCCGKWVESYNCHDCIDYFNGIFYCEHCGKQDGDGTEGTCVRWLVDGDHTCPNCKETVPGKTCHTCDRN